MIPHRSSELFVRTSQTAARIHTVRVGGYSVKVMEGASFCSGRFPVTP